MEENYWNEIIEHQKLLMDPKNAQVSIDGLPKYGIPQRFVEEEFKLPDDDEDENEDASENHENDKFDYLTDQEVPLVVEQ